MENEEILFLFVGSFKAFLCVSDDFSEKMFLKKVFETSLRFKIFLQIF